MLFDGTFDIFKLIEELVAELDKVKTEKPRGTEFLENGTDLFLSKYYFLRKKCRLGKNGGKVSFGCA